MPGPERPHVRRERPRCERPKRQSITTPGVQLANAGNFINRLYVMHACIRDTGEKTAIYRSDIPNTRVRIVMRKDSVLPGRKPRGRSVSTSSSVELQRESIQVYCMTARLAGEYIIKVTVAGVPPAG